MTYQNHKSICWYCKIESYQDLCPNHHGDTMIPMDPGFFNKMVDKVTDHYNGAFTREQIEKLLDFYKDQDPSI